MIAQALALACTITVFPAFGTYAPSGQLHGPGLVLAGGGEEEAPAAAFAWVHRRLGGSARPFGNLVVLRASGSDLYDKAILPKGDFALRCRRCSSRPARRAPK